MKFKIILIIIFLFTFACAKEEMQVSLIKEVDQEKEMVSTYKEGYEALEKGDPYFAAKKFLEAEILYPQSLWASKSALMAAYSFYLQNYYSESISTLNRYLNTYPTDMNIVYAHYLVAMCYYETIEDEKRDSGPIIRALNKFNFILENYPNTDFALDASFKIELIRDILASKEMYLGRHYIKKGKWIAAMKRFQYILEEYDQTIFVEEAIHRLVEINYKIGLLDESQKYANLLGYNYLSSEWYEKSYKIFNKDYKMSKQKKVEKEGVVKRFRKLFD
tara:strand:+ start:2573 stop:3400 length:828 start_codon:yes stop_codon:yes gene_type:complete